MEFSAVFKNGNSLVWKLFHLPSPYELQQCYGKFYNSKLMLILILDAHDIFPTWNDTSTGILRFSLCNYTPVSLEFN